MHDPRPTPKPLPPELHHEDCDYRNSSAAAEAAELFGLDDDREVFPCNLHCEEEDDHAN